jgi:hypothetical protein
MMVFGWSLSSDVAVLVGLVSWCGVLFMVDD